MTFYVFLVPVLLLSLVILFRLKSIKKNDEALFEFCQLRRDIISYLREKNTRIPEENYFEVRKLLEILNSDIHNFKKHKKGKFNFNNWITEAKGVYKNVRTAEQKKIDNNEKVEEFYKKYGQTLFGAFLRFTPFFKYKIVLLLLLGISKILAKISGDYLKENLRKATKWLSWVKNEVEAKNINKGLKPF